MIESRGRRDYAEVVIRNIPRMGIQALICALGAAGAMAEPAQPLPTPFPEARYQAMSEHSPFAVATVAAPVAAATPGFAMQLYVNGIAHWGNTDYVAIKSRDPDSKGKVYFVEVGKTTDDGIKVERIRWSDEMGKSTVDVSKGGERATLVFDQDAIATAASQAGAQAQSLPMIRQPLYPGQVRQLNFPPMNGQPQYGPRNFPPQPGQETIVQPGPGSAFQPRRIRTAPIPSGQ
jgi:hypothetical protein